MKSCQAKKGFTLVEIMVSMAILIVIMGGSLMVLSSAQKIWSDSVENMELQKTVRNALKRMSSELQKSGNDYNGANPVLQMTLLDETAGGSNIWQRIQFSMPIICENSEEEDSESVINAQGNVANWGAPLTWMCEDYTCMDADGDCATRDYLSVQYSLNNNELERQVLDSAGQTVRTDVLARDVTLFQMVPNGDSSVVTLTLTVQRTSSINRIITLTDQVNVYLRNF